MYIICKLLLLWGHHMVDSVIKATKWVVLQRLSTVQLITDFTKLVFVYTSPVSYFKACNSMTSIDGYQRQTWRSIHHLLYHQHWCRAGTWQGCLPLSCRHALTLVFGFLLTSTVQYVCTRDYWRELGYRQWRTLSGAELQPPHGAQMAGMPQLSNENTRTDARAHTHTRHPLWKAVTSALTWWIDANQVTAVTLYLHMSALHDNTHRSSLTCAWCAHGRRDYGAYVRDCRHKTDNKQ